MTMSEDKEMIIGYGLIVVDKYWSGDINHIIHFVGYEMPITNHDKEALIAELATSEEDWNPISDLEKENLKIVEAPQNVIEYYREIIKLNQG